MKVKVYHIGFDESFWPFYHRLPGWQQSRIDFTLENILSEQSFPSAWLKWRRPSPEEYERMFELQVPGDPYDLFLISATLPSPLPMLYFFTGGILQPNADLGPIYLQAQTIYQKVIPQLN